MRREVLRAAWARGVVALTAVISAACLPQGSVWGCTACYGQSDSPLAAGMNWGIFSLLGLILLVLGSVAAFFVFLIRRAAKLEGAGATGGDEPSVEHPLAAAPAAFLRDRGISAAGRHSARRRCSGVERDELAAPSHVSHRH